MAAWSSHLWFAYIYIHTYIPMVSSTLIIIIIDYSEMCTMEGGEGWDGIQEEAE